MRLLLPVFSLLIAGFSIAVDGAHPSSEGTLCALGLCRPDQLFSSIDSRGMQTGNIARLVNEDPSNPLVWCTYGEVLASQGDTEQANAAFERAATLGPAMAPVLMRAANFDFSHDRTEHGLPLARRILSQTGEFDQVLFSYFLLSGASFPELLKIAMPAEPRPARSWLVWASKNRPPGDLPAIWTWMNGNHLLDSKTALGVAQTLWERRAFALAHQLWSDSLGADRGDPESQRLWNRRFHDEPNGSPFNWTLTGSTADTLITGDELEIHFSGAASADDVDVHQFTTVSAGRYRFSAEIASEGLASAQLPAFHIFDPSGTSSLDLRTAPISGTVQRSWVSLEFVVPPKAEALEIQLQRRAPPEFRNRIRGVLHVYEMSLVRLQTAPQLETKFFGR